MTDELRENIEEQFYQEGVQYTLSLIEKDITEHADLWRLAPLTMLQEIKKFINDITRS